MTGPVCGHETANGGTCGVNFGLCDQCGGCFHHCEHRAAEREAARRKGGAMTAKKTRGSALCLDDLPPLTSHAAAEVWTDVVGRAAATGHIGASAANAALRAVKEWREARESGKVSEKLAALEGAMSEWRRTGDPAPVMELLDAWKRGGGRLRIVKGKNQ